MSLGEYVASAVLDRPVAGATATPRAASARLSAPLRRAQPGSDERSLAVTSKQCCQLVLSAGPVKGHSGLPPSIHWRKTAPRCPGHGRRRASCRPRAGGGTRRHGWRVVGDQGRRRSGSLGGHGPGTAAGCLLEMHRHVLDRPRGLAAAATRSPRAGPRGPLVGDLLRDPGPGRRRIRSRPIHQEHRFVPPSIEPRCQRPSPLPLLARHQRAAPPGRTSRGRAARPRRRHAGSGPARGWPLAETSNASSLSAAGSRSPRGHGGRASSPGGRVSPAWLR